MKGINFKSATIGFIVGATFFSGISFAATSSTIEVSFDKLNFWINGVDKTTPDGKYNNNGTEVPASFIYQGTTYLPMRMVAEMLGKEVNWDGNTKSVFVGSSMGEGDYLNDLNPTISQNAESVLANQEMKLGGQVYTNGITIKDKATTDIEYALDSKYKEFSGLIGLDENAEFHGTRVVTILGDGKKLASYTLLPGSKPFQVNVDVNGVLSLKISIINETNGSDSKSWFSAVDIVNPFLLK